MQNIQHVCVLMGGPGGEADVSRNTAKSMMQALDALSIRYTALEYTDSFIEDIQNMNADFVLIAMHGSPGEDGTVQQSLKEIGVRYNGSGVRASQRAMNKSTAKQFFAKEGLDVAQEFLVSAADLPEDLSAFPLATPFVVKPNTGGSSVGVFIVHNEVDYQKARTGFNAQEELLCEEFIAGQELTVAVMGDKALGVMELVADGFDFYDYNAKYGSAGARHVYPAQIATDMQQKAQELALKAHKSLGCKGVTRVDFRYDAETGRMVVLEINTLPGMTSTSLVPDMARHNNISFSDLISWIIKDGLCQNDYEHTEDMLRNLA